MTATPPATPSAPANMPRSYLSAEEKEELLRSGKDEDYIYLRESQEAGLAGDEEAAWAWMAKRKLTAHSLRFLKRQMGAQFIRERGFNTENADAIHGSDWLDKD